jgi:hypothetical protein
MRRLGWLITVLFGGLLLGMMAARGIGARRAAAAPSLIAALSHDSQRVGDTICWRTICVGETPLKTAHDALTVPAAERLQWVQTLDCRNPSAGFHITGQHWNAALQTSGLRRGSHCDSVISTITFFPRELGQMTFGDLLLIYSTPSRVEVQEVFDRSGRRFLGRARVLVTACWGTMVCAYAYDNLARHSYLSPRMEVANIRYRVHAVTGLLSPDMPGRVYTGVWRGFR